MLKPDTRARVRMDATLEEKRFRGRTGTVGRQLPTGLVWFKLDAMVDGFATIIVHPESLEEIT